MIKKLNFKRFIVLVIVFIMIFTTTVMAMENTKEVDKSNSIIVIQDENGFFIKSENQKGNLSKNQYVATVDLESDIYKLEDGRYLLDTGTDFYQLVDRYECKLTDKEGLLKLLNDINIDKKIEDSLINASDQAISQKNFEAKIILYVPASLNTKGTTTSYYTYNGYDCKDILVSYYNINTSYQHVEQGSSTWAVAQLVYDLVIVGVGSSNPALSLFSGGVSAATHFISETGGSIASGHYDDYLQVKVYYNNHQKYTSVDKGYGYEPGATTHRVFVSSSKTVEYHVEGYYGTEASSTETINTGYKTENYDNPASYATTHVYPIVETLSFEVDSLTVDFWN